MSNQIISFEEDGKEIKVELIEDSKSKGLTRGGTNTRTGNTIIKAKKGFSQALDSITDIADTALARLKHIKESPDEVSLEMSVKIDAEAGVVLTKLGGEAHFKLSIKWTKEPVTPKT